MLLTHYQIHIDCQDSVSTAYRDRDHWTRMSMLNVARIGKFSSDRSIRDYCADIWKPGRSRSSCRHRMDGPQFTVLRGRSSVGLTHAARARRFGLLIRMKM
jgi:hypothetical protein